MVISEKTKRTSYILKGIVILAAIIGIVLSALGGRNSFMGGSAVFMYFTVQSNIFIAAVCALGAYFMKKDMTVPDAWFIVKFVATVSITLTGVVFCVILAPTMGAAAWNFQNTLTHVVVPAAAIADFFVTGIYGDLRKEHNIFVIIPPMLYVVYAGIGFACNWNFGFGHNYPYFFLNWGSPAGAFGFSGQFPFMGTVWWILLLLGFIILVGRLYISVLNRLKNKYAE